MEATEEDRLPETEVLGQVSAIYVSRLFLMQVSLT